MKTYLKIFFNLAIILVLYHCYSCNPSTSPPDPNSPPTTTITNIPVPGDTLFPLVEITWDGGDVDGYIVGCEYQYTTYHLYQGDSVRFDWEFSEDDVLDIIFESSDVLNKQRLQIRSMDDKGAVDPTPAELILYTPQTVLPESEIIAPTDGAEFFYLEEITDWWLGIQLIYSAFDEDGEVVEYGWSVDSSDWVWTQDTTLLITPDMFQLPLEGQHSIRVTARDNTNLYDPDGAEVTISLLKPTWTKDILIIDETNESAFPTTAKATDAEVDNFYNELFDPDSSWDFVKDGMPPKNILGKYRLIIWHADNNLSLGPHLLPEYTDEIADYLNVGGNFILTGWQVLKSFAYEENFPKTFAEGTFVHDYLHVYTADESPFYPGDFTGARGLENFSSVSIDGDRLWAFPFVKKLSQVDVFKEPGGFTETIYVYVGENSDFVGQPCGIRYIGTEYNVIVLGFPLYFLIKDDAIVLAQEVLQSMGF